MTEISVVIPTYNTAAMTLRCCRAVLASNLESLELIVVDDGSVDETAVLLAREPRVRLLRLERNSGFAIAANRGVAEARGELILLLNSDAMVEVTAIAEMRKAFREQPRLGIAGAQLFHADGAAQWSGGPTPTLPWMAAVVSGAGPRLRRFRRDAIVAGARPVDWVSGAAIAFRREVWSSAGPLDEHFLFYCQDIDFCLRAAALGWSVRVLSEARVVHDVGATVAEGIALRHDPEQLWSDLLSWGTSHYGRGWGMVARPTLWLLAWLRIAFRLIRSRGRKDPATAALVRAARRLGYNSP